MHAIAISLAVLLVALVFEAAAGYPDALFKRLRHPVVWIGALIGWLDRQLNRERASERMRRLGSVAALVLLLCISALPAVALQWLLIAAMPAALAVLFLGIVASSLFAQRGLWSHVAAVAEGLEANGLAGGRAALRHIVGRDPDSLDEAGVTRAAIESLAENFSDGVVAPALWCSLFGLPGAAAYKAVNTADSMIGHKTDRHRAFGWAAARFDDLVNLPASRLSAVWVLIAALLMRLDTGGALRAIKRDARRHRSPNAGWPEAAMAGALQIRIAGPRSYGGVRREDPWMGDGREAIGSADIRRALALYRTACAIQIAAVALLLALIWPW